MAAVDALTLQYALTAYSARGAKAGQVAVSAADTAGEAVEVAGDVVEAAADLGKGTNLVDEVVVASGVSMRKGVENINMAGLGQSDAIEAMSKLTEASGRNIGEVLDVGGGAKVITSINQGPSQPIIHVAKSGKTTFGAADLTFGWDDAGDLVTTLTNLQVP